MQKTFLSLLILFLLNLNSIELMANRTDSVDVIHYNIEANIRNIGSKQIQGKTEIIAVAKFNQTKSLILDLLMLPVSEIKCNSIASSYSQTDSTLHILLDQTYQKGDTLKLEITYDGSPKTDARWGGFFFTSTYAYNMGVGMASNPPNFGRCWFPCIDNFSDKATYEFHITTDSGYVAVCNGIQSPATPADNNGHTWHWKLGQEIPTYIANVAVSKYVLVNSIYAGVNRNIPVSLAVEAKDTLKAIASFAKLNNALQCFETKFGPYQFDRVGYVGVPFNSGAMEHAGNISYPLYAIDGSTNYETLMAHELSHHWFGNLVTTNTAADMWLNEGWASYCEALFLECVYGKDSYNADINDKLFEVLRWAHVRDGSYMPVSGVPLAQTYGTHVYTKGALMAHSLRMYINDDTAFFNTVKSYLEKFQFNVASSLDLQNHFEIRFGSGINAFFNSYIFDKGHTDLQLISVEPNTKQSVIASFQLMSRHKTIIPDTLLVHLSYNLGNQWVQSYLPIFRNLESGEFKLTINTGNSVLSNLKIGINQGTMNGATSQFEWVKGNSVKTFSNALLTITPQTNPDSSYIFIQHHFVQPWINGTQLPAGVRVSSERYWNIDGLWNPSFKSTAFFNYDGSTPSTKNSGYLDNELIVGTEDSLVLLYRENAQSPFVIETDLTKQMGPSKTDKTGRFWVNNLKKGDYVFGYLDFTATNKTKEVGSRTMKVFPNPTEGALNIEIQFVHGNGKLQVFNPNGVLMLEHIVNKVDSTFELKTDNLAKGNYFVVFEDEKGKISQTIIVK
ncbi:MAG: T9SS type A sorting domain-containing protein [Bacteroidia bacterium]|nr:T9SS type A sorting domain-containing protein [Bacteroidia bacterium]MCF8445904.1 T9SS type A sorting domain-containing protein [Bacteroidia bacterium]